jgi:hypothetical protein
VSRIGTMLLTATRGDCAGAVSFQGPKRMLSPRILIQLFIFDSLLVRAWSKRFLQLSGALCFAGAEKVVDGFGEVVVVE